MGQNPDRGSVIPQVRAFENTIFGHVRWCERRAPVLFLRTLL